MGNPDQPRGPDGKWTSVGGVGGGAKGGLNTWAEHVASQLAPKLVATAEEHGGFTMRPNGEKPKDGIMVSRHPAEGHGHVVEIAKMASREPPPTEEDLEREVHSATEKWLSRTLPAIKRLGKDHYLGGWMERDESGRRTALHLDVSQRFAPRHKERAIAAGRERNQLAIWDIGKSEEIPTGGTGR